MDGQMGEYDEWMEEWLGEKLSGWMGEQLNGWKDG